jgi:2,5-furandicarboxylate decarboxylase 1
VIAVDAVTYRDGGLEHLLLSGIAREATLLSHLQRNFPGVCDVHLSRGGVCVRADAQAL